MINWMKVSLPYLVTDQSRHGKIRYYVYAPRISTLKRIRLKQQPGTPEFIAAYNKAFDLVTATAFAHTDTAIERIDGPKPNTLGWLATDYFANDADFKRIAKNSARARRNCIEECLREPLEPGGKLIMRDIPLSKIGVAHMKMLVDRRADEPGAANNRRKHMSALMTYATYRGYLKFNPMREVKSFPEGDGYHTWVPEEIKQFQDHYPLGTKERLAQEMLFFFGARGQDVREFGPKDIRGGAMFYVPKKTLHVRKSEVRKPVSAEVMRAIEACRQHDELGAVTFLETHQGNPYTEKGFGNWFNEAVTKAGLPHCTAHGLKKSAATMAAYKGIDARTMMAMFDWSSIRMVEKYTKAAQQWRLAEQGMAALSELMPDTPVVELKEVAARPRLAPKKEQAENRGESHLRISPDQVSETKRKKG
jgi:integrase